MYTKNLIYMRQKSSLISDNSEASIFDLFLVYSNYFEGTTTIGSPHLS